MKHWLVLKDLKKYKKDDEIKYVEGSEQKYYKLVESGKLKLVEEELKGEKPVLTKSICTPKGLNSRKYYSYNMRITKKSFSGTRNRIINKLNKLVDNKLIASWEPKVLGIVKSVIYAFIISLNHTHIITFDYV
jgi:hypothetical protein